MKNDVSSLRNPGVTVGIGAAWRNFSQRELLRIGADNKIQPFLASNISFSTFFYLRVGLKILNCFLLGVLSFYIYGFVLKVNRIILFTRFGSELSLLVFLK